MKADEVEFLAELVRLRCGQRVERDRTYVIETRLAPVARREGFGSIREMLLAVRQRADERLGWAVVEAMAAGETYFFRDRTPFRRLREDLLPKLTQARGGRPLRVWSAGCATGQETYSLAMLLHEAGGARAELIGSDISAQGLQRAQAGVYTQFEVQRGLPIRMLLEHFERREEMWAASAALRAAVTWKRVNLIADFSALGSIDVIFCRNVVGSMDEAARRRVLEQMSRMLPRDGVLVLGREEAPAGEAFSPLGDGLFGVNPAVRAAA
ncbi:MAG TPA: protein-glutamate O-methyltransferase CheR [Caulobacteraceae bacterium]